MKDVSAYKSSFINDMSSWEMLWQRAVAYYWTNYKDISENVKPEETLLHIFNCLEVSNVIDAGNGAVAFTSEPEGQGYKIVEVRINDGSSYPLPTYDVKDAYRPINGWDNLAVGLTVKIPKKPNDSSKELDILSQFVQLEAYYPFGQAGSGAFASEAVRSVVAMSEVGDRTGTKEVDADFEWIQFVPRLVAYIWSEKSHYNRDNLNLNLNINEDLTSSLGYAVNDGLILKAEYAEADPVVDGVSNYDDYVSVITIDLPSPPVEEQPMALADLIAKGASNPFTTT